MEEGSMINIGDIVETFFMHQKYHGIVVHVSGDYCYVELFDGVLINSLPLPLHYSLVTKVSS